MTRDEARTVVLDALVQIAPDVDVSSMNLGADMRTEADLDSMDFLSLIELLAGSTGIMLPERDYGQVRSVDSLADYLIAHPA